MGAYCKITGLLMSGSSAGYRVTFAWVTPVWDLTRELKQQMCIILSNGASDCGRALRLNSFTPLIKVCHLGSASKRASPTELNIDTA